MRSVERQDMDDEGLLMMGEGHVELRCGGACNTLSVNNVHVIGQCRFKSTCFADRVIRGRVYC
jgi:hypothetical protein